MTDWQTIRSGTAQAPARATQPAGTRLDAALSARLFSRPWNAGGEVRPVRITRGCAADPKAAIRQHIDLRRSRLMIDEEISYKGIGARVPRRAPPRPAQDQAVRGGRCNHQQRGGLLRAAKARGDTARSTRSRGSISTATWTSSRSAGTTARWTMAPAPSLQLGAQGSSGCGIASRLADEQPTYWREWAARAWRSQESQETAPVS